MTNPPTRSRVLSASGVERVEHSQPLIGRTGSSRHLPYRRSSEPRAHIASRRSLAYGREKRRQREYENGTYEEEPGPRGRFGPAVPTPLHIRQRLSILLAAVNDVQVQQSVEYEIDKEQANEYYGSRHRVDRHPDLRCV